MSIEPTHTSPTLSSLTCATELEVLVNFQSIFDGGFNNSR